MIVIRQILNSIRKIRLAYRKRIYGYYADTARIERGVKVYAPAKVVSYRFGLEEIKKHEEILYPKEERLPMDIIEPSYYEFLNKRK